MRTAWLHFRAADYKRATVLFSKAIDLSEGTEEAQRGADLSRRQLYRHGWMLWSSAALRYSNYANHPTRKSSAGGEVWVGSSWHQQLYLSAAYRYTRFYTRTLGTGTMSIGPEASAGSAGLMIKDFDHHEAYLSAIYGTVRFGVGLHYRFINDGSGFFDTVHVLGASARLTWWGSVLTSATVSLYHDMTPIQGTLAWQLPALGPFVFTPELLVQHTDNQLLLSGRATASLAWRFARFWIGGKYGAQQRPTNLAAGVVHDTPDRVLFGASAGFGIPVGDAGEVAAWYAIDQFETKWQPLGMRRIVAQHIGMQLTFNTGGM